MKLHHLSIFLFVVLLTLASSSVEAGRRRRQLDASPTVYRARFNRPLVTRNSVRQPSARQPVRYRAYIRDTADLSNLRYRIRIPVRSDVINAGRPVIHNPRRFMKFDYEHPDHYHIYHS
ncbi:Uncharacterized protein APZ42_018218 [Daphnia magna]|uniref:Uncharacterized protein n=1 Tax=Daphnia magna TaxID=35525 RepID=A0A164Z8E4_9CRUS|nr:Uncharacterized protein APZ42_018218 [Daphnia magna]